MTLTATVTRPETATLRPGQHVDDSNLKILFESGDTTVLKLSGGAEKEESIDSATGKAVTKGKATGKSDPVTVTAGPCDPEELAAEAAEYELYPVEVELNLVHPNLWFPGRTQNPADRVVGVTGQVVGGYSSPVPLYWAASGTDPVLAPGSGVNELTDEGQTFQYVSSYAGDGTAESGTVTFSACDKTVVQNLVGVDMEVQVGGTGPWIHQDQWDLTLQVGQTYLFRPKIVSGGWPSAPGNWVTCEGTTYGAVTSSWPTANEKLYQGEVMTVTVNGPGSVVVQMYGAEGFTHSGDEPWSTEGYEIPEPPGPEEPEW